jgi:hypothetical protein
MGRKRGHTHCPRCGYPYRKNAVRCPSCGINNPEQEELTFSERIGVSDTILVVAVVGGVLAVLSVWLAYEVWVLENFNPYLVTAWGLLLFVIIARIIERAWRS